MASASVAPTASRRGTLDVLSRPFHHISGVCNFRDIGGSHSTFLTADGTTQAVRQGIVFRCADPSGITEAGVAAMDALCIKKVFDLRSAPEVSQPDKIREWHGCERVFLPVFLEDDYSPEAIAARWTNYASSGCEGFVKAYTAILEAATSPTNPHQPLITLLRHLDRPSVPIGVTASSAFSNKRAAGSASPPPLPHQLDDHEISFPNFLSEPVLLHCTAGKDRTGVLCAIILSLLGVPDSLIAKDYALTDVGLGPLRDMLLNKLFTDSPLKGNREGAERMASSRPENMIAFLDAVRHEYGSVEGMLCLRCGDRLGGEEAVAKLVQRLRHLMLVKVKPVNA